MDKQIHPIYVDGPLEGQDFPADSGSRWVQAIDYGKLPVPGEPVPEYLRQVAYQLRLYQFSSGHSSAEFWVGWCSPGELDAMTLVRALCKPELLGRFEAVPVPGWVKP